MLILSLDKDKENKVAHNNYTSQLNTWLFGLNPPKQSFAHVRNNGIIQHVISVQTITKIKNQRPLLNKLDLPEHVGFDIVIERANRKTGFIDCLCRWYARYTC